MENFFDILKQEMNYGEALISCEELKKEIERYINYFNNERIKQNWLRMSLVKYRTYASQLAA